MTRLSDKNQTEILPAYLNDTEVDLKRFDDEVCVVCFWQDAICEPGTGLVTDDGTTRSVGQ